MVAEVVGRSAGRDANGVLDWLRPAPGDGSGRLLFRRARQESAPSTRYSRPRNRKTTGLGWRRWHSRDKTCDPAGASLEVARVVQVSRAPPRQLSSAQRRDAELLRSGTEGRT